jgi:hypothetical protein
MEKNLDRVPRSKFLGPLLTKRYEVKKNNVDMSAGGDVNSLSNLNTKF